MKKRAKIGLLILTIFTLCSGCTTLSQNITSVADLSNNSTRPQNEVIIHDQSEFQKLDDGLSCLSMRV
ncbi:MAG: hypothetical protein U9Q77_07780 [Candidatus Marinimicrobia bacterium]|nr:hypothetical protein [Candidatus Neomarinimicrobiota bacterium]